VQQLAQVVMVLPHRLQVPQLLAVAAVAVVLTLVHQRLAQVDQVAAVQEQKEQARLAV
jgi:hypothetical protein